MSTMICPYCGERINTNNRNCLYCGRLISKMDKSYKKKIIIDRVPAVEKKKITLAPYKVCEKCQTSNKLSATICRACNSILSKPTIIEGDTFITKIIEEQTKKEKQEELLAIIYFIIMFSITTFIFIVNFSQVKIVIYLYSLFILGLAVLCRFFPEKLFKLNLYQFFIKDPEPTDWYFTVTKFQSYLLPVLAIIVMLIK